MSLDDSIIYTCRKCGEMRAIPYKNAPLRVKEGKSIPHSGCGGIMEIGYPFERKFPPYGVQLGISLTRPPTLTEDDGYGRENEEKDAALQELEDEGKLPKGYVRYNYLRREELPQEEIAKVYGVKQYKVSRVLTMGDKYLKLLQGGNE